jgi:hypothetical protein
LGQALEKTFKFAEALAQYQLCMELIKIGTKSKKGELSEKTESEGKNTKIAVDQVLITLRINSLEGILRTMEALGKSEGERNLVRKNLEKTKAQLIVK